MKKRFLALLLAVCALCSMLAAPASASGSNAAVQTAVVLGGLASGQTASLERTLTRGQLAQLLVAFSPYRESAGSQEESGTLFADVGSQDALAPYIRIAVDERVQRRDLPSGPGRHSGGRLFGGAQPAGL